MKSAEQLSGSVIWIIAPFADFEMTNSNRFLYIARRISLKGSNVTFLTSSFDHYKKKKKFKPKNIGINVVFIYEPGYSKNVSIRRIFSHSIFDLCLFIYSLYTNIFKNSPNYIYCAIPHNFGAVFMGIISRLFGIKFILDIHDTWPENFLSVHALKKWQTPFYLVWKEAANFAIRIANNVFAESIRYAKRANSVRKHIRQSAARCVYLGGDIKYYSEVRSNLKIPRFVEKGSHRFVYAGNLGRNYDLELVIKVFSKLQLSYPDAWIVFLGGGERELELRTLANTSNINSWFSGFINHSDLIGILRKMDYGINSFAAGGNVAYSYKLNDYLLAGLPVINSLAGEVWRFVDYYSLGFNYKAGDVDELFRVLNESCSNPNRMKFVQNICYFASQNLDWNHTYQPIFQALSQNLV